MSRYARIAITLPQAALTAADRLARAQDRSRSWVVAEAIRRFADASRTEAAAARKPTQPIAGGRPGLGDSRLAQLHRDLELTPEERVRAAEETARLSGRARSPVAQHVTMFERIQDYVDWKRQRDRV
jgi:predicted transcriptional regulator